MLTNPWVRASFDAWSLGLEASSVIALRMVKIGSGGGAAEAEVRRMVIEKIDAGVAIQAMAMAAGIGLTAHGAARTTLAYYRRKVRANRRRLIG
jgi:hypothetical protein